jgi:hypothetical protein
MPSSSSATSGSCYGRVNVLVGPGTLAFGSGSSGQSLGLLCGVPAFTALLPDGSMVLGQGKDRSATLTELFQPQGLLREPDGAVLLADCGNGRVLRFGTDGSVSVALDGNNLGFGPEPASGRTPHLYPEGFALMPDGSFLVVEPSQHRVLRVTRDGSATLFAGTGIPGDRLVHGDPAATQLNFPTCATVLEDGTVILADRENERLISISPLDELQTQLEGLVASGVSAAMRDDAAGLAKVHAEFAHLLHPDLAGEPGLRSLPSSLVHLGVAPYLGLTPAGSARVHQARANLDREVAHSSRRPAAIPEPSERPSRCTVQ